MDDPICEENEEKILKDKIKLLEDEHRLLEEILGSKISNKNELDRFVSLFLVSIIAAITFVILFLKPVDQWFEKNIPNSEYRLFAKALILFVVVFIADAAVSDWRFEKF